MDKIDLEEVERVADYYEKRKQTMIELGALKDPAYLATLAEGEAIKAFEALRPLVARVRELERQREWLAKHIERYCDMTCPWSLGIYDKKHKCPHWTPYEDTPKNDSFEAWEEYLFGGVEFEDDTINCGTPISICLIQASKKVTEQAAKEGRE